MRHGIETESAIALIGLSALLTSCKGEIVLEFAPDSGATTGGAGCGASCGASTEAGLSSTEGGATSLVGAVANPDCPAPSSWLPTTPAVPMTTYAPHPDTECPFYQGAYQNFLIATAPLGSAAGASQNLTDPALVNYPTIDDAFQFTIPHLPRNSGTAYPTGIAAYQAAVASGPTGRAWLGTVRQAGQRNVLVDQDDHTLYYGLHMNQAFYDFIQQNGLNTVEGILNVDASLSFPPGLVEFKTAWKDIDPQDFPDESGNLGTPNGIVPPPPEGDFAVSGGNPAYMIPQGQGILPTGTSPTWDGNYITTLAWLPYLTQDSNGVISEDADHPLLRKVALVAIHVVYTLPGHPEFVWGSIQHVNLNAYDPGPMTFENVNIQGAPDSQPYGTGPDGPQTLPSPSDPQNLTVTLAPSMNNYLLYKGGTPENAALQALPADQLMFDEVTQSFPGRGVLENVYRMFPESRSTHFEPDTAVFSLNSNLNPLYADAIAAGSINPAVDKRFNYRLVAALWLDKPYFFGTNYPGTPIAAGAALQGPGEPLQNDETDPLIIGVCGTPADGVTCMPPNPINLYPNVSQGTFCGTPLDATDTSGDSPRASASNNSVPGCLTRADLIKEGDNPEYDFLSGDGGTDDPFSLLAGADRLSSTAMETFTQNDTFHNCFACHNTEPVSTNGTPYNAANPGGLMPLLTRPANLNVSHLFSAFVLRDATEVCNATTIPCPGELDAGP